MTKPRVTTADRLSNIIEIVELGRKSGLLAVERGSNQTYEQGEVYFFQGRAIYAAVEGLRGREALGVLGGWGQCRFAFESDAPAPTPNVPLTPPAKQQTSQRAAPFPASSQPGYPQQPTSGPANYSWSGGARIPDSQSPPGNGASRPGLQRGEPTGALGSPLSPPSTPSTPSSVGGGWNTSWPDMAGGQPTSGQLNWPGPGAPTSTGPFAGGGAFSPELLARRPRRAPDVRDLISVVSAYNLSRNHRTVLLLADGEHSVLDLARLSSKPVEEIFALLADLERRGLVYYY